MYILMLYYKHTYPSTNLLYGLCGVTFGSVWKFSLSLSQFPSHSLAMSNSPQDEGLELTTAATLTTEKEELSSSDIASPSVVAPDDEGDDIMVVTPAKGKVKIQAQEKKEKKKRRPSFTLRRADTAGTVLKKKKKKKTKVLSKQLNSQLNGRAERHHYFDEHLQAINIQMVCLSWAMVLMLWIYNDACYDLTTLEFNDSYERCQIAYELKLGAWFVNIIFFWRLCAYYRMKAWSTQSVWGFPSKWAAFRRTSLWKGFCIELFIAIVYPLPTTEDYGFANNWLSLFTYFRCYLILRALRDASSMWKNRDAIERHFRRSGHSRESITFKSVWIVYYHQYTVLCVGGLFFFTMTFFSYNVWLAEREFWNQGAAPPDPYKVRGWRCSCSDVLSV